MERVSNYTAENKQVLVLANIQADSLFCRIEMNVIIIAACIPTLRPVFLILFKRPGASNFRASVRERGHSSYYYRTSGYDKSNRMTTGFSKAFDKRASGVANGSTEAINTGDAIDRSDAIQIESREAGSRDGEIEQ